MASRRAAVHRTVFPIRILNPPPSRTELIEGLPPIYAETQIAAELRKQIAKLYRDFISADGKRVDYKKMSTSIVFANYVELSQGLAELDVLSMSQPERRATFLNVYNALLLHAFAIKGRPSSLAQRMMIYDTMAYRIAGHTFTLHDIEHGVLRGNRPGTSTLFKWRPFRDSDPRIDFVLPLDPRIHFCLNCGAMSCPAVQYYSTENSERAIRAAARGFVMDDNEVCVNYERGTVHLNAIFDWYKQDFGDNVLEALADMLPEDEPKREQLLALAQEQDVVIKYLPYQWQFNDSALIARGGLVSRLRAFRSH